MEDQASAFKDPWKECHKWVECVVLHWIQTVDFFVVLKAKK